MTYGIANKEEFAQSQGVRLIPLILVSTESKTSRVGYLVGRLRMFSSARNMVWTSVLESSMPLCTSAHCDMSCNTERRSHMCNMLSGHVRYLSLIRLFTAELTQS